VCSNGSSARSRANTPPGMKRWAQRKSNVLATLPSPCWAVDDATLPRLVGPSIPFLASTSFSPAPLMILAADYVSETYPRDRLFYGHWPDRNGRGLTTLTVEQVSHHPPITAYCIANASRGVMLQGHNAQKTSFSGELLVPTAICLHPMIRFMSQVATLL